MKTGKKQIGQLAKILGISEDQVLEMMRESKEDQMKEAQSVINYYESGGEGFKQIVCRQCSLVFAYSYSFDGVKFCSIECAALSLASIGIVWTPGKPQSERWGQRVPAVVPPGALSALQNLLSPIQDAELSDTNLL